MRSHPNSSPAITGGTPGGQFSSPSHQVNHAGGHHNPSHHHHQQNSFEPPPKKRKSSRASVEILTDPDQSLDDDDKGGSSPADIECILCRRKFTVHSFKFLNSQGPPLGGLPYFPFLRTLSRLNDEGGYAHEDDPQGRVRACSMCTTSLINQWTIFQRDALPIEERSYNYLTITGPQSSGRCTPGDTTMLSHGATATPTSGRSLHSPNTPQHNGGVSGAGNTGVNNTPISKYHAAAISAAAAAGVIVTSVTTDSLRGGPPPLISTESAVPPANIRASSIPSGLAAPAGGDTAVSHSGSRSLHGNTSRLLGGCASLLQVPPPCPSPGSVNSGASGEPANHKPSTSSFYCFLCGLHSGNLDFSLIFNEMQEIFKAKLEKY